MVVQNYHIRICVIIQKEGLPRCVVDKLLLQWFSNLLYVQDDMFFGNSLTNQQKLHPYL